MFGCLDWMYVGMCGAFMGVCFFGRRILELINAWIHGLDVVYCSLFSYYITLILL